MFPGVDGFHWTFGHIFFVSVFLTVVTAIAVVAVMSVARTRRDVSTGRAEPIRWHADFADLSGVDRACRHALTGEVPGRICPNGFDCRTCAKHPNFRQSQRSNTSDIVFGLKYPNYRYYHRGHTWVTPQPDGTAPGRARSRCPDSPNGLASGCCWGRARVGTRSAASIGSGCAQAAVAAILDCTT